MLLLSSLHPSRVHRAVKLPCLPKKRNFDESDFGETNCRTVKSEELLDMLKQSVNVLLPAVYSMKLAAN